MSMGIDNTDETQSGLYKNLTPRKLKKLSQRAMKFKEVFVEAKPGDIDYPELPFADGKSVSQWLTKGRKGYNNRKILKGTPMVKHREDWHGPYYEEPEAAFICLFNSLAWDYWHSDAEAILPLPLKHFGKPHKLFALAKKMRFALTGVK